MTQAELSPTPEWEPPDPDGDELDRLQRRINTLKDRIHDALPEGYDMSALIAAGGDMGGEDVFDITSDELALVGLTGPLNVPGWQPQPAFDDNSGRTRTDHRSQPSEGRWGRVLLLIVAAAALAAAAYLGGLWWASRSVEGEAASLGAALALMLTLH